MFGSIVTFIIVLSVLILVHELGHFFAAKRAGIWVEEFGFGIPPRIIGKKFGETIYSINLFPFGGFVRLHGENSGEKIKKPKRAFLNKSAKVRAFIVVAGVIMNFLLGVFVFSISYSFSGIPRKTGHVQIVAVNNPSPAEESGLKAGDIIEKINGEPVKTNEPFMKIVNEYKGTGVTLDVKRGDENLQVAVVPRLNPPQGEGALGIVISDSETYFPPIWQRPFLGAYYGFREALFWGGTILSGLKGMLINLFAGELPKDVAGPAGLYVVTTEVAKFGFLPLINWLGIVSVNLAILNILPIPALDGGRLLFIGIGKAFNKKIIPKVESWLNAISMGLLITFLLAITFREVRMILKLGFSGYLDYLSKQGGP
jgi:regulator of sigma E protease